MTSSGVERSWDIAAVDELLTVAQAGDYLGTGERFVRRLVAERRISYVKLGKYVRLQRSTLNDFIEAGRVPSDPQLEQGIGRFVRDGPRMRSGSKPSRAAGACE